MSAKPVLQAHTTEICRPARCASLATPRTPRGFTLIELLVVLVLLALFSGMVVLSIGDSFQRKMQAEAERLQTLIIAAADEAIFTANEFGFRFERSSYSVLRYDRYARNWQAAEGQAFKAHQLPEGMVVDVSVDGFAVPVDDPGSESEFAEIDLDERLEAEAGAANRSRRGSNERGESPQLLVLSSGEMSVFDVIFEAEDEPGQRASYKVSSDGFTLPRVKPLTQQETTP
ncbi:MAG: type II secretion system minor pseudopilin GspH [Pseudomonadales bacterium]